MWTSSWSVSDEMSVASTGAVVVRWTGGGGGDFEQLKLHSMHQIKPCLLATGSEAAFASHPERSSSFL